MTVARSSAEALAAITTFLTFLHVLPIPARTVEDWMDLLRRRRLPARMFLTCSLSRLCSPTAFRVYTFNVPDFAAFPELAVVTP